MFSKDLFRSFYFGCILAALSSVQGNGVQTSKNDSLLVSNRKGERELLTHLFARYQSLGRNSRPVLNASHPVNVKLGLGLIQMDLNEKMNILSMSMWTRFNWKDEFLTWDPAEYSGITSIRVRSDQIWIPDIMLYNTANVDKESRDALALVRPDGSISYYPHSIFRSACSVDVKEFPFDIQTCNLWFGSWTYSAPELDLNMSLPNGIDLSTYQADYLDTAKWEVLNVTANRLLMPPNDTEPFVVLTYELVLGRRIVFSTYMLTMPCVFLSCLTLIVFWLPPERPDRTALAMNSFASFMVLLLILVEAATSTAASVPTLGLYYCFNLVIIMAAIFLSSMVVNISRGHPRKRPSVLLRFVAFHLLSSLVCLCSLVNEIKTLRRNLPQDCLQRCEENSRGRRSSSSRRRRPCCSDDNEDEERKLNEKLNLEHANGDERISRAGDGSMTLGERQMENVRQILRRLEDKFEDRRLRQQIADVNHAEWKAVGYVLDRFFMIVYVFLIGISLAVFFPRPPR